MKKILFGLILFLFLLSGISYANNEIVCPAGILNIQDKETVVNKISGVNFVVRKTVEKIIKSEIKKELGLNVNATLEIFSINSLKNGEFKELKLRGKNLRYGSFSLSGFEAQTICPYNKVVLKNGRIYYPESLNLKYTGKITNADIQYIINSDKFKNAVSKISFNVFGKSGAGLLMPKVEIKQGFLFFDIPVQAFFLKKPVEIKLYTEIEVIDNKIILKNIKSENLKNGFFYDILNPVLNILNPLLYNINAVNGKYCNVTVTNAQISDNIINVNGIITVNKNYGGAE